MNHATLTCALLLAFAASAAAEVPRKAPLPRYSRLWTDSPFTSKPPPKGPDEQINPLNDYILSGIAPILNGYRLTIINRKNPEDRQSFDTTSPDAPYKLVSVKQTPGDPLGTEVRLASGSITGTVKFEKELLVLKPPTPAAPPPQQLPPGVNPQPNQQGAQPAQQADGNRRTPRPRVQTPPQNGNNNQQQRNNRR